MTATATSSARQLLDELQSALQQGSVSRRVETLRRVTDLFIGQSADFSDDQIAVFDDVFGFLVQQIEAGARVLLSERLAKLSMSPPRIVRTLAFDDLIEVAAPMLAHSHRLDDASLIENASSKSQAHLLAISRRSTLSANVTDVLVTRGDDAVVESTARNPGAAFSDRGYENLIARTRTNEAIALAVGLRKNIPRPHYLKLIARASRAVRDRLEAANAGSVDEIGAAVGHVADEIKASLYADPAFLAARHLVESLLGDNRLDEAQLLTFAHAGKYNETLFTLSCLANVPVEVVETVMVGSHREGVLVLAKVAGLSWAAVKAVLGLRGDAGDTVVDTGEIEVSQESYERLRSTTAQQVLRFYNMQKAEEAIAQAT